RLPADRQRAPGAHRPDHHRPRRSHLAVALFRSFPAPVTAMARATVLGLFRELRTQPVRNRPRTSRRGQVEHKPVAMSSASARPPRLAHSKRATSCRNAHALPLSVDGIEIVASLVLLADRRAGRRSGWLPWAALAVGTAGSLAANVAIAGPGMIYRVIAGWPALALLIAVKLLSGMLDQHNASRSATNPVSMAHDRNDRDPSPPEAMPVPSRMPATRPQAAAVQPRNDPATRRTSLATNSEPGTGRRLPAGADLLPIASAARDKLHRD